MLKIIEQRNRNKLIQEKFQSQDFSMIDWHTLKSAELYQWIEFVPGIKFRKIYDSENLLLFETDIDPGMYFNWHGHDCFEDCFVVQGKLHDKTSGREAVKGEYMNFQKGIGHEPGNPLSQIVTKIIVTFKHDNFNSGN